eukprot:scaffold18472_cov101-Isochrysis_galbana.AAC.3
MSDRFGSSADASPTAVRTEATRSYFARSSASRSSATVGSTLGSAGPPSAESTEGSTRSAVRRGTAARAAEVRVRCSAAPKALTIDATACGAAAATSSPDAIRSAAARARKEACGASEAVVARASLGSSTGIDSATSDDATEAPSWRQALGSTRLVSSGESRTARRWLATGPNAGPPSTGGHAAVAAATRPSAAAHASRCRASPRPICATMAATILGRSGAHAAGSNSKHSARMRTHSLDANTPTFCRRFLSSAGTRDPSEAPPLSSRKVRSSLAPCRSVALWSSFSRALSIGTGVAVRVDAGAPSIGRAVPSPTGSARGPWAGVTHWCGRLVEAGGLPPPPPP